MRTNKFNSHINLAMRLAKNSPQKHQHGCVVLNKRGRVIGKGYNNWATHANMELYLERCSKL